MSWELPWNVCAADSFVKKTSTTRRIARMDFMVIELLDVEADF
jgi:hypothetical protein